MSPDNTFSKGVFTIPEKNSHGGAKGKKVQRESSHKEVVALCGWKFHALITSEQRKFNLLASLHFPLRFLSTDFSRLLQNKQQRCASPKRDEKLRSDLSCRMF